MSRKRERGRKKELLTCVIERRKEEREWGAHGYNPRRKIPSHMWDSNNSLYFKFQKLITSLTTILYINLDPLDF